MRRKAVIIAATIAMALSIGGPITAASADTLIGANVCDVSVLVENDDAASNQCHNE